MKIILNLKSLRLAEGYSFLEFFSVEPRAKTKGVMRNIAMIDEFEFYYGI